METERNLLMGIISRVWSTGPRGLLRENQENNPASASRQSRSGPENVHGGAEKENYSKGILTTKMGSRGSDTSPQREAV